MGGTQNAWFRANRAFADELRQQFLLWRSLPIETVTHYRKLTEDLLATEATTDLETMRGGGGGGPDALKQHEPT